MMPLFWGYDFVQEKQFKRIRASILQNPLSRYAYEVKVLQNYEVMTWKFVANANKKNHILISKNILNIRMGSIVGADNVNAIMSGSTHH